MAYKMNSKSLTTEPPSTADSEATPTVGCASASIFSGTAPPSGYGGEVSNSQRARNTHSHQDQKSILEESSIFADSVFSSDTSLEIVDPLMKESRPFSKSRFGFVMDNPALDAFLETNSFKNQPTENNSFSKDYLSDNCDGDDRSNKDHDSSQDPFKLDTNDMDNKHRMLNASIKVTVQRMDSPKDSSLPQLVKWCADECDDGTNASLFDDSGEGGLKSMKEFVRRDTKLNLRNPSDEEDYPMSDASFPKSTSQIHQQQNAGRDDVLTYGDFSYSSGPGVYRLLSSRKLLRDHDLGGLGLPQTSKLSFGGSGVVKSANHCNSNSFSPLHGTILPILVIFRGDRNPILHDNFLEGESLGRLDFFNAFPVSRGAAASCRMEPLTDPGGGRDQVPSFSHGCISEHMSLHLIVLGMFTCEMCKQTFTTNDDLQDLINSHLTVRATFTCEMCKPTYPAKHDIQDLINSHLTVPATFTCELRKPAYPAKHDIQDLINSHLNVPAKFTCEICKPTYPEKHNI